MLRKDLEEREKSILSPYAALSLNSKGRKQPLTPCPYRTEFQRDRDRIIHSKSFRRLKYKTQVYLPSFGDHFRTRLTHTLEVSQISRSIARGLRLNEDLAEAIALGHDIGHAPFGHAGERTLDELMKEFNKSFQHNIQSLRVVEELENEGRGLNLTIEVLNGIKCHTGDEMPFTLEGQVVRLSDRIAYVNHDIDDSVRAGLISLKDIPDKVQRVLGQKHGERINSLVADLINNNEGKNELKLSPDCFDALNELRYFLYHKVYRQKMVMAEDKKSEDIVKALFHYYMEHSEELPNYLLNGAKEQAVLDYIAGMTDNFALNCFSKLHI